jgi:hypothetical protein
VSRLVRTSRAAHVDQCSWRGLGRTGATATCTEAAASFGPETRTTFLRRKQSRKGATTWRRSPRSVGEGSGLDGESGWPEFGDGAVATRGGRRRRFAPRGGSKLLFFCRVARTTATLGLDTSARCEGNGGHAGATVVPTVALGSEGETQRWRGGGDLRECALGLGFTGGGHNLLVEDGGRRIRATPWPCRRGHGDACHGMGGTVRGGR